MLSFAPHASRFRFVALALTLALYGPAAQAGFLTASAAQNPLNLVANSSLTAERVSASVSQASSFATRTQVDSRADGSGTRPETGFESSAGNSATYTLWDVGTNAPISLASAQSLQLQFNFSLTGFMEVREKDKAAASTRYLVGVGNGNPQMLQGTASGAYAIDRNGIGLLQYVGDPALVGRYTLGFAIPVQHTNSVGGSFTMIVSNYAGVDAIAYSTMTLVSVVGGTLNLESPNSLTAGASSLLSMDSLAVRINETGLLIPVVSAVPEPSAAALTLLGLFSLIGWRRRAQR